MDAVSASSSPAPPRPRPLRIVICPWLAFGHMLPYLELAERLASRGHRVSYVSTPRNLARLPPPRHTVDLVALQLPRVEGLPEGAESTNDIPGDRRELLLEAFDGLAAPFAEFLIAACADDEEGRRPDWIVVDTFYHWAPAVAVAHKVPCAMLQPSAALISAMACGARDHAHLAAASIFEQITTVEEPPAGMPRYEWRNAALYVSSPVGTCGMSIARRITLTLEGCAITAMRSCPEWELHAFSHAAALLGKPLVPLGLLPPSPEGGRGGGMNRDDATVRWLDAQPSKSVVYVALGSEVPLRMEQVHELAHGLELTGTCFLWALRKPSGVPDSDVLPPGFLERTRGQGLVTMGWVPQITILAHGAVGAFLTHCGRNSLMEGLQYGHPLIMLPIFGDQGSNARLMAGRKVGLQVPRDEDDGSFDRQGIADTVRAVMIEEDTRRVFLANAMKLQEVVADKELQERKASLRRCGSSLVGLDEEARERWRRRSWRDGSGLRATAPRRCRHEDRGKDMPCCSSS